MFSRSLETLSSDVSLRGAASRALLGMSRSLAKLARALRATGRVRSAHPVVLEFYAEAGAPEGALYVDGQLVGHLSGVTRL